MIKFNAFMMIAALALFSTAAHSNEATSYSKKKQGRISFEKTEIQKQDAENASAEQRNVSDIEPAAGAQDEVPVQKRNSLKQDMKLPRKN